MFQKLEDVEKRYDELTTKISDPEVISRTQEWQKLMKEHAGLEDVVTKYREYKKAKSDFEEAKAMASDKELKELAEAEMDELRVKRRAAFPLPKCCPYILTMWIREKTEPTAGK